MTTTTYAVTGMTCGHCEAAVTKEVLRIPGVTGAVDRLEAVIAHHPRRRDHGLPAPGEPA